MAMRAPYFPGYPVWRMITDDKALEPAFVPSASRFDIWVGLPDMIRYTNCIALDYLGKPGSARKRDRLLH
jgi:hypothetical protein